MLVECGRLMRDLRKPRTKTTAIRPLASTSSLADSLNTMLSKPSFWNAEFLISGSRFVFSQLSAIPKSRLSASSLDTPY